jgi:flagellar hook-associated protein FlgK
MAPLNVIRFGATLMARGLSLAAARKALQQRFKGISDALANRVLSKAKDLTTLSEKTGKPIPQLVKEGTGAQTVSKNVAKEGLKLGGKLGYAAGAATVVGLDALVDDISKVTSDSANAKPASAGGSGGNDRPKKTFKSAFADARAAGKKTFMFEGKKYTTDVAEDKKKEEAPKPKPKAKAPAKKSNVLSETDASTARSFNKGGYANCGASVKPNRMSRS